MGTPTLTTDFSEVDDCDAITNWTGNSVEVWEIQKEGAGCVGFTLRTVGNNDAYWNDGVTSHNLTGKHIRVWYLTSVITSVQTYDNGGIQLYVSDGANTGYWKVSGSDKYGGGWQILTIDTAKACDSGTKPDLTAVTTIGLRQVMISQPKNVDNTWLDYLVYGSGYAITDGTSSDEVTWDEIATTDLAAGYGVVEKKSSIFFVNGALTFGDASGANDCYFKDTSDTIVFLDERVSSTLYNIDVVANTGTTKFQMGETTGGRGISGCILKSAGDVKFSIDGTDSDVTDFKLYGCTFQDAGSFLLPETDSNKEVISCNFTESSQIEANSCKFQYNNIISADDRGILINDASHQVTDSNIIDCGHGVHFDTTGTFTLSNVQFSGNTYDLENSTSGLVTVNCSGTPRSNPTDYENTGGGTTSIVNTITLTVTVKDTGLNNIEGARVIIEKTSDHTEYLKKETLATGIATEDISYPGDTPITVRVRKSPSIGTRYIPYTTSGIIYSTGYSTTVILTEDTIA